VAIELFIGEAAGANAIKLVVRYFLWIWHFFDRDRCHFKRNELEFSTLTIRIGFDGTSDYIMKRSHAQKLTV
jgi:hypothetical protein